MGSSASGARSVNWTPLKSRDQMHLTKISCPLPALGGVRLHWTSLGMYVAMLNYIIRNTLLLQTIYVSRLNELIFPGLVLGLSVWCTGIYFFGVSADSKKNRFE